ncbi:single-stranded DNA-binding protein [Specibacter sp. RAF43]|uniref:single-stranded DNA-binding protein n=1 Tax=Specibacter sp. RAF43 TaxID=3233057 RepID=UPI003F9AFA48
MANQIALRGFVCSDIILNNSSTGVLYGNFRMGSNDRVRDRVTNEWGDGPTNWYRVSMFRSLALNTVSSIHKGDKVIVIGKLRVTQFVRNDGTPGTGVEIEADAIGPDLMFGTTHYERTGAKRPAASPAGQNDGPGPWPSTNAGETEDGIDDPDEDDEESSDATDSDTEETGEFGTPSAADAEPKEDHVNKETGELTEEKVPF